MNVYTALRNTIRVWLKFAPPPVLPRNITFVATLSVACNKPVPRSVQNIPLMLIPVLFSNKYIVNCHDCLKRE